MKKKKSEEISMRPVGESELEMIKIILRGERAILAEYDLIKRKEERNKLTRIDPKFDIELSGAYNLNKKVSNDNLNDKSTSSK